LPALARAVRPAVAGIVLFAGVVQFSGWKMRSLACCRAMPVRDSKLPDDTRTALRHGMKLGLHCSHSCANLTAILLAGGVMDLRLMALVTAAITAERIAPDGERVAKATGIGIIAIGTILAARVIMTA
jgi:predicted metal-binding membrane protein